MFVQSGISGLTFLFHFFFKLKAFFFSFIYFASLVSCSFFFFF